MAGNKDINICIYTLKIFALFIGMVVSDEMTLNINLKKPIAVVSQKFLSITLDPVSLFNSNSLSDVEKTTSMAKALAPAYVRIGGPRSNSYIFERGLYPKELQFDPGYTFSEAHWIQVHQWAESSGLDIIACLAPQQSESSNNGNNARASFWDPRNALDLISFSDHMGYNISWQLGYECQTRCDVRGAELGRDVQRLRNMLDAFPRYAERGMIVGPDVVTYKTRQQQQYLQDYFNAASGSLSAVTWHPDFASISLEADGVSMHYDNLAFDKDAFYRAAGRHISKKPLWIAESRSEECKQQFLGALVWARRLGNSAKLGLQVIMRQPDNSNLFRSTPDYWVSILHKMLVGREVLDTKITTGNRTHVHFYSQCTNPSSKYEKGSLTVFGINLTPSKITASLKGIKLKVIHKYILLPGYDAPNRMFAETVLLNNEPLNLIDEKEVPDMQPAISNAEKGVKLKLPSGGIGFWVLPGLKVKSCMGHVDEIPDKNPLRKINRRFEESDGDIDSTSEDENNRETTDVNSVEERKPSLRLQRTTQKRLTLRKNIRHKEEERDDLDERKLRKLDGARHDFDRLENIMRKKDQHTVNLKSGGTHGVFENSGEEDNGSSEEGVFRKTVHEQKVDSGEVIRAKLQEYKNRLSNYESRKKQREILSNLPKDRFKDEQDESINKGMNTEKVIEALTLITKVESAMKGLEKENENEVQITSETPPTLGIGNSNDVTAGLQRSNSGSQRGDDVLLDEVLNTEKSKRTSIPARIEDQLKALYYLLSEEKEKRDRSLRRRKRDVDKRLGDDPLSLPHDNIFLRKRIKTEEAKERLIERVNERKQRLRERQEQKREKEDRDSNENNFYGFQHREPLKNFPAGDVYFHTEVHTNKNKRINCDYNDDDNINKEMYKRHIRNNWKRSNIPIDIDEYKNLWLEESGETKHIPTDFFENLKLQTINSKENFKNYGELLEIESFHKNETNDKKQNESDESENHEIVTEISLRDSENHKTEERATQQLINFYKMNINEKNYDLDDLKFNKKEIQSQLFPLIIIPNNPKISSGNDNFNVEQHNRYINTDRYHDNLNKRIQPSESSYHRTKRYLNNLEDLLHQEMITQDNNNLKDCQCRVIRGIEECKDCDLNSRNFIGTQLISIPNQAIDNYNTKIRIQRDLNKETNTDYLEKTIDSGADSEKIETMNSERPTNPKESSYIKNEEPNFENYNKTEEILVPTIIKIEDGLSIKNINDKTWNRLPRKIESSAKFLLKSEENLTKPAIKKNSQVNQQKNSDINDFSAINAYIPTNETETAIERTNIRSVDITSSQHLMTSPLGKTEDKTTFSKSTRFLGEKSLTTDLEIDRKSTIANVDISEKKETQNINDQTTIISITNNSTDIKNIDDINSKNETSKIINVTTIDHKIKPKNNSAIKIDERIKSRQARLTTRAEALTALKKENESRRAKKMIEASMKIIDMEKSKFAEYQKRRYDQIERLKRKLRAKREKMLQQYRTELLEVINDNSESKESNIHRRDLFNNFQAASHDITTNDMITNSNEFDYSINSNPIKYSSEKDTYKSTSEKCLPAFEMLEPFRDVNSKQALPKFQTNIYIDDDNSKMQIIKDKKQKTSPKKHLKNEDAYNINHEEKFRIKNNKRSPYALTGEDAKLENYNHENINNDNDNKNKYYIEQPQVEQYNPHTMYNEDISIPLHVRYSQQPLNTQHAYINFYKLDPSYVQETSNGPFNKVNPMNTHQIQDFNMYSTNDENTQESFDYKINRQTIPNPQLSEKNIYQLNTPNYEDIKNEQFEQNCQKVKRSNLKISEIHSSMCEDNESNNTSHELLIKPSYVFSSRSYGYNPYTYVNRRHKREAMLNNGKNMYEPLSISLGLEKSKMVSKNSENGALPNNFIRKKRVVNEFSIKNKTPIQYKSPNHKNIKKVHTTDFKKIFKKLSRMPRYIKLAKKILKLPIKTMNKQTVQMGDSFINDIPIKVERLHFNNYLNDIKTKSFPRQKRSMDQHYDYQIIESNGIDRFDHMNELWNDIGEEEKLLQEYDKKNNSMQNFIETQHNFTNDIQPITEASDNQNNLTIQENSSSIIQTNIGSILIDSIPKLQTVITGGLKKAENLTGSLENFIDNYDNQLNNTRKRLKDNSEDINTFEVNNERLNHNIFKTMIGSVKKFFGIVSGIAKIFHVH